MATVKLIGPNGARFEMDEPLPGWVDQKIEAGEWQRQEESRPSSSSSAEAPRRQPRKSEERDAEAGA